MAVHQNNKMATRGKFQSSDLIRTDPDEREQLLGSDSDDDDFFLSGPKKPDVLGSSKISGLKSQVNEVTNVMKDNVGRMLDRGERLSDLQQRSEQLDEMSTDFRSQSTRMRKKFFWENAKMKIAIGSILSVLVIIIIIIASRG